MGNGLDLQKLKGLIPDLVLGRLRDNTPLRLAHFLSQCAHESANFSITVENLNYSSNALSVLFPKYFDATLALKYARDPVRIGSRIYASRMGNGDEASKEGYRYRGRGYLQITGKTNYAAFSKYINYDCVVDPEAVSSRFALDSAYYFFDYNKLWSLCDTTDCVAITKRVNGGTIGLLDREKRFKEIYSKLGAS